MLLLAAVPGFGAFAYLAARPVRANRLLLRALTDAALQKAPWRLYERSGLRRLIARPSAMDRGTVRPPDVGDAGAQRADLDAGPNWELAGAVQSRPAGAAQAMAGERPATRSVAHAATQPRSATGAA